MAIDWMNMANPFTDPNEGNAFAPGGPSGNTITGSPVVDPMNAMAILAFTAPEELAAMMAKNGIRPGRSIPLPSASAAPFAGNFGVNPSDQPPPPGQGVTNPQSSLPATGPAGLTGTPANSIARAIGAVKALQPPAVPMVPAPAAPRISEPAAYRPDASSLMGLIQMMSGQQRAEPTLAQLMGMR